MKGSQKGDLGVWSYPQPTLRLLYKGCCELAMDNSQGFSLPDWAGPGCDVGRSDAGQ